MNRRTTATAPTASTSLVTRTAHRFGVDPARMLHTLKQTAFRLPAKRVGDGWRAQEVTNEQMMALLVVADQHNLNPFTREIYAFPDKGGAVVPIVSVDGWIRLINSRPELDGIEFRWAEEMQELDGLHAPCPAWCEAVIHRTDRSHPVVVPEFLQECYRPPFIPQGKPPTPGPWQTHTRRMLRHKALIQCARVAFGFAGLYDPDEGERIIEGELVAEPAPEAAAAGGAQPGVAGLKERLAARDQQQAEEDGAGAKDDDAGGEQEERADATTSAASSEEADSNGPAGAAPDDPPPITADDLFARAKAATTTDELDEIADLKRELGAKDRNAVADALADAMRRLGESS